MNSVENYNALTLETEARNAESNMMAALDRSDIFSLCYAKKSRIKKEHKLIEKVRIKTKKKPHYSLSDITDVIGIRFVTLFRNEIPIVCEKLIEILFHEAPLVPNPFVKGCTEEIIIYTTDEHNGLNNTIIEILTEKGIPSELIKTQFSQEGYSSIHIVTRLQHGVPCISCGTKEYSIPVEIQIRTVFEDAWGEIDHKFGYVIRQGKESGIPIQNQTNVLGDLKILKKFTDACTDYADFISTQAMPSDQKTADAERVVSVNADSELIKTFERFGVEQDDIDLYILARKNRIHGQEAEKRSRGGGVTTLLQTAESFKTISSKYTPEMVDFNDKKNYLIFYYSKMNEAICLLSTNQKEQVQSALNIYLALEQYDQFKVFPLLQFRLGQAHGKMGQNNRAIAKLKATQNLLIAVEKDGYQPTILFPKADYDHIKQYLPIMLGYELWKKADTINVVDSQRAVEKINILKDAYMTTQEGSDSVNRDKIHTMNNNLLYYSFDIKKILKEYPDIVDKKDKVLEEAISSLPQYLEKIEMHIKTKKSENLLTLDTLMRVYDFLEDGEKAKPIAIQIIDIGLDTEKNKSFDRDVVWEIIETANLIKKKY